MSVGSHRANGIDAVVLRSGASVIVISLRAGSWRVPKERPPTVWFDGALPRWREETEGLLQLRALLSLEVLDVSGSYEPPSLARSQQA
jgi:hypothetical protein